MLSTTRSTRGAYWPAALAELANARLTSLYWPTVAVALLAMTPGLINFTALDMARPTIGQNLGVSANEASWATLLGNVAMPLGLVVGAGLMRHVRLRRLTFAGLALLAIGAVCGALAANLPMLILAHAVQSFGSGLVSAAIVVSILTESTPDRLPITVSVLGIALFGATTLGPLIGGIVEQTDAWREFLVLEALVAVAAVVPTRVAVPNAIISQRTQIGVSSLLLVFGGLTALFIGIAELSWYHWTRPEVETPLVLGAVCLLGVIIGEWALGGAPATLRLAGLAKISCLGAFGFGGVLGLLLVFLQQVRGLGAQDAGMLLWPAPVTAFLALVWIGALFNRPRWVLRLAVGGVLLLALAAWQLASFTEYTGDSSVMQLAALLGLGVSLSVSPMILLGTLSVHKDVVGRALALMACLPYVLLAASGPVLTYVSSVRQTVHYTNLQWEQGWRDATTASTATSAAAQALVTRAQVLGINDAALIVVLVSVLGLAVAAVVLRSGSRGEPELR